MLIEKIFFWGGCEDMKTTVDGRGFEVIQPPKGD